MTLEEKLEYYFFDKRILTRALATPAYAIEQQNTQPSEDQQAYSRLNWK
jgi:dsRNA-specific ribonuclease